MLAAEVEAAGRLTEISSTRRARRLSDRHPDLKERIQALVGPGSRWASRSQLPAGVAGRATTLVWDHLLDRASARPQAPAPTADARELPLVRVAALPELLAGRRLVAASVGPAGQAVLLAAPGTGAERPDDATVLVLGEDGRLLQRLELGGLELERPMVQPLPDGEVVVVGARCRRFADGTAELNAQVHGPDGTQRRAFTLGDGIRDVQATTVGQLWVAYRDEGVDGSHGWAGPGGPEPIGSAGLVRFDLDGCRQWAYRPPAGLDPIGDASAMNVADEDVWLCCYPTSRWSGCLPPAPPRPGRPGSAGSAPWPSTAAGSCCTAATATRPTAACCSTWTRPPWPTPGPAAWPSPAARRCAPASWSAAALRCTPSTPPAGTASTCGRSEDTHDQHARRHRRPQARPQPGPGGSCWSKRSCWPSWPRPPCQAPDRACTARRSG